MIDGQAGRRISFAQALVEALLEEMRADASIYLVGSYLLGLGPKRVLMDQVRAEFPARVWDPPISEAAAATSGARRALGITSAPACARPRAMARPIPELPPITTAVFPFRSRPG